MEQWNNINPESLGIDAYVKRNLNPENSMQTFFDIRYLNYVEKELGIKIKCTKDTVKEKIDKLKPLIEQRGLETREIYTKNQKNKLKKLLKYFLGEDGIKLLWVDEKNAGSGYLLSNYDYTLMDMLLDIVGTYNNKILQEDKDLLEYLYKQFCTLAENETNNLTKEFIDWRWSVLFNARFQKAIDALEDLHSTIAVLEPIASDKKCNIEFWDYVTEQIEMIHENIKTRKSQIVRHSDRSNKELQDMLLHVEKVQKKKSRVKKV